MFYEFDIPHNTEFGEFCHPNCDCGRFMEIGNNVFMQYKKTENGFEKLAQPNVDFGGGLERIAAALQNDPDMFKIDILANLIKQLEDLSGKSYEESAVVTRSCRIIADHIRAATFIIGDPRGVTPSNVGQGYVVRRLLRRAIREGRRLGIEQEFTAQIALAVVHEFGNYYTEIADRREHILEEIRKEESKFGQTLEKGMRELEKRMTASGGSLSGEDAFILFSSYGFPLELTEEVTQERGGHIDREVFAAEFKKHQELSRTASAGTFKGGLADSSIETTRLHTATHLLHEALRQVLGAHVGQKGSNITAERLRFDFSHPQKMTLEEIAKVEEIVNNAIKADYPVTCEEMTVEAAKARNIIGLFEDKYAQVGNNIKAYFVGDYSKEICGGPHVTHTGELGSFKIQKEEAVSAGVRRIKAVVTGPIV
jgi:alanyl-tRNA synthetase